MKKLFVFSSIALILGVMVTACSDEASDIYSEQVSSQSAKGFYLMPAKLQTRATLSSTGDFRWEAGDQAVVYNHNLDEGSIATAANTGDTAFFYTDAEFSAGQVVTMFFPAPNGKTILEDDDPRYLNIDLTSQDGSLDSMANQTFFQYGEGGVTNDIQNGAINVYANFEYANTFAAIRFIDGNTNQTLTLQSLEVEGATCKGKVDLKASSIDEAFQVDSNYQDYKILVSMSDPDTIANIAMLPTNDTLQLAIKGIAPDGTEYVGTYTLAAPQMGYRYPINIVLTESEPQAMVEWAPANFRLYNSCNANSPSAYGFYCRPWQSNLTSGCVVDLFRWGVIGRAAWDTSMDVEAPAPADPDIDISGKMYTDKEMTQETTDFCKARYGDIVYWATKGKWRLPKQSELKALTQDSSWVYGRYAYAYNYYWCGQLKYYWTFGVSFRAAKDGAAPSHPRMSTCHILNCWDVYKNTFLPMAYYKKRCTHTVCESYYDCRGHLHTRYVNRYSTTTYGGWCSVGYMTGSLRDNKQDNFFFGPSVNRDGSERNDYNETFVHNTYGAQEDFNVWYLPIRAVRCK